MESILNTINDIADYSWQLCPSLRSYSFCAADLPATPAPHLDLLTYNVEVFAASSKSKAKRILDAIVEAEADICLLQETSPKWEALISVHEGIRNRYHHTSFQHPTGLHFAGGFAVLSKYPLSGVRVVTLQQVPGSIFPFVVGSVITPVGELQWSNVHLRPPLEMKGGANLSTARRTGEVRSAEAHQLMLHCVAPDLVAGDFNEQDGGHALAYLKTRGLSDALAEHVPRHKETHNWPHGKFTLKKRLDHILYSAREWVCVGCGVVTGFETNASDHQPVLARFRRRVSVDSSEG